MAEHEKIAVQNPYCLAMVVCDHIWTDNGSGKMYVMGTFSTLGAMNFPVVHPVMAVYVAMTDGRGKISVKVQLVDADEERDPVFVKDGDVEFKDPRMIAEMGVHMINVTFPEPGEYRLQLLAAGDMVPLMERRILVMTVPQ